MAEALMRRQRRAQVVGHAREDAGAQLVDGGQVLSGGGFGLQLAVLDGGGQLLRERLQHPLVLTRCAAPTTTREHVLGVHLDDEAGALR